MKNIPILGEVASDSPPMRELLALARRVTTSDSSILVTGETGSGKEWLARSIHSSGPRARRPFIAVNCSALPEGLFESEVFGHVEGAFTGALRDRLGCFQRADGGTLLLDEIGDVPLPLQAKLLRVLQERQVLPVGGDRPAPVDVRIIAATNRDLTAAMEEQRFRPDLYYRLSVMQLHVPPLRDRLEDVEALVRHQLQALTARLRRPVRGISEEALRVLEAYSWPGNIRELVNVLERSILMCRGSVVTVEDLPRDLVKSAETGKANGRGEALGLHRTLTEAREEVLRNFEIQYLSAMLSRHKGRLAVVADRAGIHPRTLYNKMREYGLRKEEFRNGASELTSTDAN